MADTLESRVAQMAERGMSAIQIHESFRKQGLDIPWVSVLAAFTQWQSHKGGR